MPSRFLNNIRINEQYTLPVNDGSAGQAIVTDGSGNLSFGSAVASSAESAESIHITVKNTSGSQITKGTPVYITGETGNSGKIEVAPADASDSAKMPAVGILESTLNNNAEGFCVQGGLLGGLSTATIDGTTTTVNDTVYVKSGGGLTMTKPTGSGNLIQNIAKVARTHASNGSLVVSSILRTNDVPNLPTGKIWVGDGNTTVSTVVHLDETNGRMGVGTNSPTEKLFVNGGNAKIESTSTTYLKINSNSSFPSVIIQAERQGGTTPPMGQLRWDQNPGAYGMQLVYWNGYTENSLRLDGSNFRVINNGSERMRIDSSGLVGIGTTSPSSRLHVKDVAPILKLQSSSDTTSTISFDNSLGTQRASLAFYDSNDSFKLTNAAGNSRLNLDNYTATFSVGTSNLNQSGVILGATTLTLISNFSTALTCDYAGRVGIGTTSPQSLLHVGNGSGVILSAGLSTWVDNTVLSNGWTSGVGDWLKIEVPSADDENGFIQLNSNGNVGIGTTSPGGALDVVGPYLSTLFRVSNTEADATTKYGSFMGRHYTNSEESITGMLLTSSSNSLTGGTISIGGGITSANAVNEIKFYTAANSTTLLGSERMRITNSGNVGIGTTSPSHKLEVFETNTSQSVNVGAFEFRAVSNHGSSSNLFYHRQDNNSIVINEDAKDISFRIEGVSEANLFHVYAGSNLVAMRSSGKILELQDSSSTGNPYLSFAQQGNRKSFIQHVDGGDVLSLVSEYGGIRMMTGTGGVNAERVRIDSSGNVGIGTTGPGTKLDVVASTTGKTWADYAGTVGTFERNGDSNINIVSSNNGVGGVWFGDTDSMVRGRIRYEHASDRMELWTNNSEKVSITSAGNVGIGTTSPGSKLDINNNIQIDTYSAGTTIAHNAGYIKLLSDAKTGWAPGDELGKIEFYSKDTSGIGTRNAASIRAVNNQGNGSSTTTFEGELAFYTSLVNTTEAEAVRIDSAGNVGIGTTSPSNKLEVVGSNAVRIHDGTDQGSIFFRGDRDDVYIKESNYQLLFGSPSGMVFELDTNLNNNDFFNVTHRGSSRMYIDGATGNVGIGTTSPRSKLHAVGTVASVPALGAAASAAQIGSDTYGTLFSTLSSGRGVIQQGRSDGSLLAFDLLLNPRGGNVGIGVGTSVPAYTLDVYGTGRFTGDLRCLSLIQTSQRDQKKDIANIDKSKAKAIPFKEYKYKSSIDGSERKRYGVVVEDIEDDYPELVHIGNDGIKGINYIDLLVKRVAELEKELEDISLTPGPKGDKGDAGSQGSAGANGTNGKDGVNGNDHLKNVKSITFNEKSGQLEITIEGYKGPFRFNPAR